MNTGKLLLGVLAGVAAGALLGVLFAPDKGSETRKKITRKGTDYADDLKNKFNEFVESATEKLDEAKTETSSVLEKNKARIQEFKTN
jgi:gas vesicle protein